MDKKEVQQRVLKGGKPLDLDLFTWDEKIKTFSSKEDHLVIDFSGIDDCTFKTGYDCTFKTRSNCTFETGYGCTFKTSHDCTFNTGYDCTFKTRFCCTFKTWSGCTFDTGSDCTFKTESHCTFDTRSDCTFETGFDCVVVRRDVFEVIQLQEGQKIRLNSYKIKGFSIID